MISKIVYSLVVVSLILVQFNLFKPGEQITRSLTVINGINTFIPWDSI